MAQAFVQSTNTNAGTVSSGSLTFPSANTLNGLNLVGFRLASTVPTINSVTDSNANTYINIFSDSVTGGKLTALYYTEGITSGPNTVSFALSTTTNVRWAIFEYSGVASSKSLDKFASTTGAAATTARSPTVTISTGIEMLFGWGVANTNPSLTPGANYTLREGSSTLGFGSEDRFVTVITSYDASLVFSSNSAWGMGIATFFGTSAGAGIGALVTPRSLALLGVGC